MRDRYAAVDNTLRLSAAASDLASAPVIELIGGNEPYLWLGSGTSPARCFCTIADDDLDNLLKLVQRAIAMREATGKKAKQAV